MEREDEIRLIAYGIWEEEQHPDGRDSDHWFRAEAIWEQQHLKGALQIAVPKVGSASKEKTKSKKLK